MAKKPTLVHAGRMTYASSGYMQCYTLFSDATDALAWNPKTDLDEARRQTKQWSLRKKADAQVTIDGRAYVKLGRSTNGDVWTTGKGIVMVDLQPKGAHKLKADKLALLTERVLSIPAQPPRFAGKLAVRSRCLALFDPRKPPAFTADDIAAVVAAKEPRALRLALLVPVTNGCYELTYEQTAKKSNWAPIWYEDELGAYSDRVTATKQR